MLDRNDPQTIAFLTELRALHAMPISTKDDLENWYLQADIFEQKLKNEWIGVHGSIPHELFHYLSDADIRSRDSGYLKYQEDLLRDFLFSSDENTAEQDAAANP